MTIDAVVGNAKFRKQVEVQLHCEFYKRSVLTVQSLKHMVKMSEVFEVYAHTDLGWCALCSEHHPPSVICFSESDMDTINQDILLHILNSRLSFQWTHGRYQEMVFSECH